MKPTNLNDILSKVLKNKHSAFFYTPPFYKDAVSYFFEKPTNTVKSKTNNEINSAFEILNNKNLTAYALVNYEAGYTLEKRLNNYYNDNEDNLLFNIFNKNNVKKYDSNDIVISQTGYNDYNIDNFNLNTTEREYKKNIAKIKQYLIEGYTYQVNYTLKSTFDFSGDFISLFRTLLFNQSAKYSAFINLGDRILISLSPELFFSVKNKKITAMPMKGTMKRGVNNVEDKRNSKSLKSSAKDKAENLMIVDLLRNDLGKICKYGSVQTEELFSVEKYESLFQMVSKVTGKLKDKILIGDVIKNIFPCGSVTGAPKIRTMEIIKELEKEKRGIYTGAIGIIENNNAVFNVSIRTLEIDKITGKGTMGLGSGIVIDSDPLKEYEEVKLKGNFLREPQNYFELFETMLIENGKIKDWLVHINRMKMASEYFLFSFNYEKLNNIKNEVLNKVQSDNKYRLKLLLKKYGELNYEVTEYINERKKVKIILSEKRISSNNTFQYFKTTNRNIYNDEYQKWQNEDFFDVIFLNEKGELSEGAISNIFVKIKGNWFTPKINCGILNGIERSRLLKEKSNIKETAIALDDLANAENIILTNSLRRSTFVDELHLMNGRVIYL